MPIVRWIAGAGPDLTLEFAKARGVHGGKWRTGRGQRLRIGHATRSAEDAQELIALAGDASEEAEFLKNHGPGNYRKNQQEDENHAGHPARLAKNISQIGDE